MNKKNLVEAILFTRGESVAKKYLMDTLEISDVELGDCISELKQKYNGESGIVCIDSLADVALGTNPELSQFFQKMDVEERGGELSKASLETLSILLYKNGATRSEIDYVRGVNSSFILRNLYIRGLVEKKDNARDSRSPIYVPTIDTMRFLGITSINELPEYADIINKVNAVFQDTVQTENEGR
jgi:segregation and condensation protein B